MKPFFFVVAFLLGLMGIAVLPSMSSADGCIVRNKTIFGYGQYQNTGYIQKAVVAPYVGYNNVYVPKAVEVIASPEYYYSVGSYYRDKLLVDAIAGRILEAQKNGQIGGFPSPNGGGGSASPPPPPIAGGAVRAGAFQEPKLLAIVTQTCARCHAGGVSKGGFTILTEDGKLADLSERSVEKVFRLVSTGAMPQGGKPVEDAAIVLFNQWADEVAKKQVGTK